MRITTWTEYSLIIAIHLAKRGASGSGPVAAREIAEQERLPGDYVEQILLRLRRAGLVESVRGARGGYYLAKEPRLITMRDIMAASEHQTFEMNCDAHPVDAERCAPGSACSVPMTPGSTPSTPPSAQLGTRPGGGGSRKRQR